MFRRLSVLTFLLLVCLIPGYPALTAAQTTSGSTTTTAELWDTYFEWRELGNQAEALSVALQLRDAIGSIHGPDSTRFGMALAEVGISRLLADEPEAAFTDLRAAEELLQDQLPLYSEKLIRSLTFLGAALKARGQLDQALDAYSRAQHITHRLWGAENPTQIPLAYAKANVLQASGDLHQAEQQYLLGWKLNRINHGPASAEAIKAAADYGTWLRSVGEYDAAISHFHQTLDAVQEGGPDRPEALPLLRGLAHAYRGGYRGKFARSSYQRIIKLMEREPDAFSIDQKMELRLSFGDWLMQRYFERDATRQYEAAWALAHAAGPDGAHWLQQFRQPQMVRYGEMAPTDVGGEGRLVTFNFQLTRDGRVRRVKVADATANSRDRSKARKNFPELTRYRPAIVDGKAQAATGMTATMYLLPDGVALEPAPVAAPARITSRTAVATSSWTMLRGDEGMVMDVADKN